VGSGPGENGRTRASGGTRKDTGILTTLKEVPSAKNSPRPKTTQRPGQKGRGRRAPARSRPTRDLPVLPLAIGGIFLAVFLGLIIWYRVQTGGTSAAQVGGQPVNNIQCQTGEQLATHYHAHVDILYHNGPATIPANTGIPSGGNCIYWMHTHDESGIIHIEAPQGQGNRKFTLGDFFAIWGQPLSRSRVATITVGPGQQLKVWVNGTPYTGDPSKIVLKSHEQIVLEIGPPYTDPPPTFTWPAGV
jgi:hypothetical protein